MTVKTIVRAKSSRVEKLRLYVIWTAHTVVVVVDGYGGVGWFF